MANEFKHAAVGVQLTQAEYEGITAHTFDGIATGDILYASSATQLSRLAIGGTDTLLQPSGGIPAWAIAPILNNCVAKGTWTASGTWTIPAVTLGGTITSSVDLAIKRSVTNGELYFLGGTAVATGAMLELYGGDSGGAGKFEVSTPNAAQNGRVSRLIISGVIATAVATWGSITHTGLDITSGQTLKVGGTSVVGAQGAAVADADGTLADITTKFNAWLGRARTHGLIAT